MQEKPARSFPVAFVVCRIAAILWGIPWFVAAMVLLLAADTAQGRIAALAGPLLAFVPLAAVNGWLGASRRWAQVAGIAAAACAVLLVVLLGVRPRGNPAAPARAWSWFAPGTGWWIRWCPTNLVPEGDQLAAEFSLMTLVDPLLGPAQAAELRHATQPLYREMSADPDFAGLGSAMPETYADLAGVRVARGHAYVYAPRTLARNHPAPVLVFFHGFGGNFKAYLWILSQVADRTGCVLVAPSNGIGSWNDASSAAALDQALTAAAGVATIDRARVHLAGLSNGGLAVSELAGREAARVRSLIFISPVFDPAQLGSPTFARLNRGRPALVISGGKDNRVPLDYVEAEVRTLRGLGAEVELKKIPDADHFLIFTHRAQLVDELVAWLGAQRTREP